MSLGLKRGTVQLEPHDKQWDEAAIQTIKKLKSILGDDAVDIQHIGSTAIPAIKAKPIIDIAVGVTDFDKVMLHNEQLRQRYECTGVCKCDLSDGRGWTGRYSKAKT